MKLKIVVLILFAASFFIQSSCRVASNSNKRKGEIVTLRAVPAPTEEKFAISPLLIAVIPFGIDLIYQQTTKAISKSGEGYTAAYSASVTASDFYRLNRTKQKQKSPDSLELNIDGFELMRTVKMNDKEDTVAYLKLKLDMKSNMLYFLPETLFISKAKAKVKPRNMEVSLQIEIELIYYYYDKEGKFKNETIDLAIGIPSVQMNKRYTKEELLNYKTTYFPLPPISRVLNDTPINDLGNYYLQVTVSETDEFGKKLVERAAVVENSREDFIELLGSVLKEATNKSEDGDAE